jgi:hypothetical protein
MEMASDPREDLAFIRQTIEEGRRFVALRGAYLVLWGGATSLGYVGTYLTLRGWVRFDATAMWTALMTIAWLGTAALSLGSRRSPGVRSLAGRTLAALWLACSLSLSLLFLAASLDGGIRDGWFIAVTAGIFAVGFFVSGTLCHSGWMRWLAVLWWAAEPVIFLVRHDAAVLLVGAALAGLGLLGPGIVLTVRPRAAA